MQHGGPACLARYTGNVELRWGVTVTGRCLCRQALLGFNAVRIEWNAESLSYKPINYAQPGCKVATTSDILATLTAPDVQVCLEMQLGVK